MQTQPWGTETFVSLSVKWGTESHSTAVRWWKIATSSCTSCFYQRSTSVFSCHNWKFCSKCFTLWHVKWKYYKTCRVEGVWSQVSVVTLLSSPLLVCCCCCCVSCSGRRNVTLIGSKLDLVDGITQSNGTQEARIQTNRSHLVNLWTKLTKNKHTLLFYWLQMKKKKKKSNKQTTPDVSLFHCRESLTKHWQLETLSPPSLQLSFWK